MDIIFYHTIYQYIKSCFVILYGIYFAIMQIINTFDKQFAGNIENKN